jgi:serine/threonine-protein kinase RIM15
MSQINMLDGPSFRPLDVLICEDHPVSHLVMEALLEKLRCRTITVGNGDEATRYAMSDVKFDIIMMEFKLPRINGADVARMIRDTKNANSHTPIVAVTGYLKELQAPHHFDAMIEKPPTTSKLAEVMSRLCNWVPPPPRTQTTTMEAQAVPGSGLRQESSRLEDSPSSTSSGYVHLPGATFRGSSREDSISSSFFGDVDSTMADDAPIIINAHHRQGDDWGGDTTTNTGLGISEDALVDATKDLSVVGATLPHLIQQQSAPPALQHTRILGRQRSAEKIKAKREGMERSKRLQGGESGDDEDEELGNVHVRARSPVSRGQRTSKLGVEMMRTNSRGSVISNPDIGSVAALLASTSPPTKDREEFADDHHATITPPEMFPTDAVGETVQEFDVNKTPQGPKVSVEAPTPRAPGKF